MQLSGPPTLNGTEVPYPDRERPLEAAFQRDSDVETYVKARSGRMQRTSERAYRVRFRFVWEALPYDQAHDLLSAASRHPVSVVPRTKEPADPQYLQEHTYDCRVVEDLSGATPLYRRDGHGNRLARVTLELESVETFERRPEDPYKELRLGTESLQVQTSTQSTVEIPETEVVVSVGRTMTERGMTIGTTSPGTTTLVLGTESLGRSVSSDAFVALDVSVSRSLTERGMSVSSTDPGATTLVLGTESLTRATTTEHTVAVVEDVQVDRTLAERGMSVSSTDPGATALTMGTESVTRATAVQHTVEVEKVVQVDRTLEERGMTVTSTEPEPETITMGTEAVTRSVTTAHDVVSFGLLTGQCGWSYDFQTGTFSWNAAWEGGAAPYDIEVYDTDQQLTLIDSETGVGGTSASGSTTFGDPGGSVWMKLIDANGDEDFQEIPA